MSDTDSMRVRRTSVAALALAVTALLACAPPPPCAVPTLPVEAPFLWRVERDGAVVWLFGTIHNAGADSVPPAAWAALEASPRFASELGNVEADPELIRELATLPRGKGLDALLAADDWWDLSELLRGVIRADDLKRTRPWYAMSLITGKVAPSPDPTMDVALARRARARHLPVDALETWRGQLTVVADAVTLDDLRDALHARGTMRCDLAVMRGSYDAGSAARMERHLNIVGASALVASRNAAWLPALEAHLAGGGAFVAVGLGHLLGPDGLPAKLAARGYTVLRVTSR